MKLVRGDAEPGLVPIADANKPTTWYQMDVVVPAVARRTPAEHRRAVKNVREAV
jgi:hypothetical protein